MPHKALELITEDNVKLAAVLETPAGPKPFPLVVLIHGYNSNKDNDTNTALVTRLLERGIAALRFDFRGSGGSQGKIENVTTTTGLTDLAAAMAWVRKQTDIDQQRVALLGGSYGGVVTTLYAAAHPGFACLVLKAPATDWGEARSLGIGPAGMEAWKRTGYHLLQKKPNPIHVPYSFYEDISSYDAYAAATRIHCPVLIVHGDADTSVPIEQSRKLAQALGGEVKLEVFPGADHRFTTPADFTAMIDQATTFLTAHLL